MIIFNGPMKYIRRQKVSFDILGGFLTTLLKEDMTVLKIVETKDKKNSHQLNKVDLLVKDSSDRKIVIEVKQNCEGDYLQKQTITTDIIENAEKKGKLEGIQEGKLETAKAMLNDGRSIDKVILYTGLPKNIIENLKNCV
ncbi:hypothetical protein AN640_08435 [Candidatus Epulonipiscium fishelsonii]|uniref:Uncharacterized protein n=1 Tax=Candidatus Epulonipiscium fishelsonii TaxID=77094 RepID=A0ACC8XCZ1_9FIRM|nr:hypothetical protein AN640_08435 [Epulopiscium sp. SCG-D08WGA-EpuloA1]OON92439.1 MAG: hypothetical protein ATN32_09690 [Epulopiscium sp. AS2M-Bin002]